MLIGVTGLKQHGKSTIANILVKKHGFVSFSFADGVRRMAEAIDPYVDVRQLGAAIGTMRYSQVVKQYGYESAKALPDVRRLLQRIGAEGGRNIFGENVWVGALDAIVEPYLMKGTNVVIPDVRFPNEAFYIEECGGTLIRVERPIGQLSVDTHDSEKFVGQLPVAYTIRNTGSIQDLEALIDPIVQLLEEQ